MDNIDPAITDSLNTIQAGSDFNAHLKAAVDHAIANNNMQGFENFLASMVVDGSADRNTIDEIVNYVTDSTSTDYDLTGVRNLFKTQDKLTEVTTRSDVSYSDDFINEMVADYKYLLAQKGALERLPEHEDYLAFVDIEGKLGKLQYGWTNNPWSQARHMFTGPTDKLEGGRTPSPITNPNEFIIVGNMNPANPEKSYELAVDNILSQDAPYLKLKDNFYTYARSKYGKAASVVLAELLKDNVKQDPQQFFKLLKTYSAGQGAYTSGAFAGQSKEGIFSPNAKLYSKMLADPMFEETYMIMKDREKEMVGTFTEDYKWYREKMPFYYRDIATGYESLGQDIKNENIGHKKLYEDILFKLQEAEDNLEWANVDKSLYMIGE
jgi:hypothetical protein